MKLVVQRCGPACVRVGGSTVARIHKGAVILLGVARTDTDAEAEYLAGKVSRLRIFDDSEGRLNASIHDTGGSFLVVSQFTLYGDCSKGNRPSYIASAPPAQAQRLYLHFVDALKALGHEVQTGFFQETMHVELENDGPVTLILERDHPPSGENNP